MNKELKEVVVCKEVRNWCRLPYLDHPNGCRYYGQRDDCPPRAKLFNEIVKPPYALVAIRFNLDEHVRKLKKKHANWSDRQAGCVWYFQGTLNKRIREECEKLKKKNSVVFYRPESNGVNVFETCKRIGLRLKRNPKRFVWKVAIIGVKK